MTKIIAFSGRKQSGKSTSGEYLQSLMYAMNPKIDIRTYSFADPLKQICINLLIEKYIEIYKNLNELYEWNQIKIDFTKNPTKLSDELIFEFFKSPLTPTEKFLEHGKYILDDNINKYFILDIYGTEFLPDQIKKYVIFEPQRSENWTKIHKAYNKDSLILGNKFSMIRGAIGEMFITENTNFDLICKEHVEKCMIGFIRDDKDNLCAPDLLLINKNQDIIPVEIKCLPMDVCFDINNKAFYRELKLAKKQIKYI